MSVVPKAAREADKETQGDGGSLENCRRRVGPFDTPGEVRCPVCFNLVPAEHIGYKLHCRHCGYLESCCNPV